MAVLKLLLLRIYVYALTFLIVLISLVAIILS